MKKITLALTALVAMMSAQADVLFQHSASNGQTSRGASSAPGTYFSSVAADLTINRISVENDLNGAGNLKFVIFDHSNHTLLWSSDAKFFADDGVGQSWKASDLFSFTLQAGHAYDIGAIADVSSVWAYDCCNGTDTQNGLTAAGENVNFSNFNNPTAGNHAATIIPIILEGNLSNNVPEPGSLALIGATLLGAAGARRKARKQA